MKTGVVHYDNTTDSQKRAKPPFEPLAKPFGIGVPAVFCGADNLAVTQSGNDVQLLQTSAGCRQIDPLSGRRTSVFARHVLFYAALVNVDNVNVRRDFRKFLIKFATLFLITFDEKRLFFYR